MVIDSKSHHRFIAVIAGFFLFLCTSCSGVGSLATATPSPKTIDTASATVVEFPVSWPKLRTGMSRREFSGIRFVNPWIQVVEEPGENLTEKVVYSLGFYEYFFINDSLKNESAKNNCQYFGDEGGVYKGFFPVSISRAKDMLISSAKPLGFSFSENMPNNISSMAWSNYKAFYAPSLEGDYERHIYRNELVSSGVASSPDTDTQFEQTLVGFDFRRGLQEGHMVGGVSPITGVRYDGILYAEFREADDGTLVYIETDSRFLVMKSRAKSFAKSILMHMACRFSDA